ncbi:DinB family protein [Bacillus anthracis]|uniref:DinB family protein n=1 Tax=Bacillus tropicus TaxID=2026188 RepID=A0ABD7ZXZ1_9BACI|nr:MULTISPECIES: DinB family protein [Bacillus]AJG91495.1 dinB superfamily protein [Bacillus cereus]AJH72283.1 dinB superfamily protein [Bacillus cereus ATCC 4342]PDY91347.1 DinB family protein [Bacillus anthracis]KFM86847.1 dinB superfamily protein [Bacillus cereus ATCC 4342]MDR4458324.1 DinB family protein [Bacillus tropicus]
MKKENILEEKLNLIEWCQTLKGLSDDMWLRSFKEGSWGIADVISHFIVWDTFLINHRIPYFISEQSVPNVPIDVEEMNKGAIKYARSGISKEEILDQFSVTRKKLIDQIERIPVDNFYNDFQISTKKVRLNHYFSSLIQHDLKHKEEIMQFLIQNQAYNKNR